MKRELETPEILAQAECKRAITKAANKMLDLYEELTEKGLIKGVGYSFNVCNSGYEFIVKPTFEWSNLVELPAGLEAFICQSQRISLQPDSFFNDHFYKGEATLIQYINIGKKWDSTKIQVEVFEDIKGAGNHLVNEVSKEISKIKKLVK